MYLEGNRRWVPLLGAAYAFRVTYEREGMVDKEGAPNDGFLLDTLLALFRLPRLRLDVQKCILSGALTFVSVRLS